MTESYRAICNDFYINQKLAVKMDLPSGRETVLDLFERVRKQFPAMAQFRRYESELALESPPTDRPHRWLAVRPSNIRSGVVNPDSSPDAYGLHRGVLEIAPYFLSISPLDIDYLELLFGFDISAAGNHDDLVHDTLFRGAAFGGLADIDGVTVSECQPLLGVTYGGTARCEAHVEVKTRAESEQADQPEAISVYLTVRRYGPFEDLRDLPGALERLAGEGESFADSHVVPNIINPLRSAAGGAPA